MMLSFCEAIDDRLRSSPWTFPQYKRRQAAQLTRRVIDIGIVILKDDANKTANEKVMD